MKNCIFCVLKNATNISAKTSYKFDEKNIDIESMYIILPNFQCA